MQAWDEFLAEQEREIGKDTVSNWLRTLKVVDFDACNLYLQAKDSFQILWFEEHIRRKINAHFTNNNGKKITVHLSLSGIKTTPPLKKKGKKIEEEAKPPPFTLTMDGLNPHSTFNNFVVTDANLLAFKLLTKVSNYDSVSGKIIPTQSEHAAFNPIYLHGAEGTGKTHLLMATAHALKSRSLNVVYARCETFTEHVVSAIRAGEMSLFRQAYRNIDVLIIDDVQVLSRKGATQEEFFHTFNTLHLGGKQIILSACCSPAELQHVEPRLISRFEWGIVLPLETLDSSALKELLYKKAESLQFNLNPKVSEFLLETFKSSPTALCKALEALVLRTHMKSPTSRYSATSTTPQAKYLLEDLIRQEENEMITSDTIIAAVSEYFGIRREDLEGKGQSHDCVLPRQIAMYFCRNKLKMPFTKIGDLFFRDHSTVMTSVKHIDSGIKDNSDEIATSYTSISKLLKKSNKSDI